MLNLVIEQDVVVLLQHIFYGIIEVWVSHSRAVQAREQIADQTQEERHVVEHELG